jgi:hypothetical protein
MITIYYLFHKALYYQKMTQTLHLACSFLQLYLVEELHP